MSQIISYFKVFKCLPKYLVKNIRCFFVTQKDPYTKAGYFVTKQDIVYTVTKKRDDFRVHNSDSETDNNSMYEIIFELCDKSIEEFFEGNQCMFARSKDNHIFVWGQNAMLFQGETGQSNNNSSGAIVGSFSLSEDNYSSRPQIPIRPQKLDYFDDKNIIQISCSQTQCLALSADGLLYRWGHLRSGDNVFISKYVSLPKIIPVDEDIKNQIQSVFCYEFDQDPLVITFSGDIYQLTENGFNSYFDLKCFLELKKFGENKNLDQNNYRNRVNEIILHEYESSDFPNIIFQKSNNVFEYIIKSSELQKNNSKTIFEYFLLMYESTLKTIHLRDNQLFIIKYIQTSENRQLLKRIAINETIISNVKQFSEDFDKKIAESMKIRKSFHVFNDLPKNIESEVKCYYFSEEYDSFVSCIFIVMSDSTVFGYGYNKSGKLGFGHKDRVNHFTRIPELSDQNIEDFFEGNNYMFARNDKNQIYGWGSGQCVQSGRLEGGDYCEYTKPHKLDYFDDKNIVQMSCTPHHYLALSLDGAVYKCANNYNQREFNRCITPEKIHSNGIKFIKCYNTIEFGCSTLINIEGKVLVWQATNDILNENCTDEYTNLISQIEWPIQKCLGHLILCDSGYVYTLNMKEKKFIRVEADVKFNDIFVKTFDYQNVFALQSEECVYELIFDEFIEEFSEQFSLSKTEYLNFYDFYLYKYKIIYKTIHITSDGFLITKDIKFIKNYNKTTKQKRLQIEDKNVFDRKFDFSFKNATEKGQGTFGVVFEVRNKSDTENFAIKRITLKDEDVVNSTLSEVKILSKLNSDFVVKYITAWIEVERIGRRFDNYAYIQMELCSQSLKEVIKSFKKIKDERFETFKYYISCELFRELTECVDYLHSLKTPIIHRDLKPANVLISDGSNGRFVKLCDFGLAKLFIEDDNTRGVGTIKYMAPEVLGGRPYNLTSDVYSLAVIAIDLFDIKYTVEDIREKRYLMSCGQHFKKRLLETLSVCFIEDIKKRPDCKMLLKLMNEWTVDKTILKSCDNFSDFIEDLEISKNQFLYNYFNTHMNYTDPIPPKRRKLF